jgi:aldose 1-epimerase
MELPSGQQFTLTAGDTVAVITEVGGGIRHLQHEDVEILDGFPETAACDGARGQTLLPWPNRVEDGRYRWGGQDLQLALTEPDRHNAIHGLTRWANWELIDLTVDRVELRHRLHAQIGWPFLLRCDLRYELRDAELEVTTRLQNVGQGPCPAAAGDHPYLSAGGGLIDDCQLHLQAGSYLPTDDRGIPISRLHVAGSDLDFSEGRRIGDQQIDLTFTELSRSTAVARGETATSSDPAVATDVRRQVAEVRLHRPDGHTVRLWAGEGYDYLELFTGDTLAPAKRRRGLGVEPMTSPPNALQSGTDLAHLDPGQSLELRWGVGLV